MLQKSISKMNITTRRWLLFCRDVLLADLFVKRMFILDCAIAFLLEYMNRSSLVDFDTEIETLSSTQWPNSSKTLKYGLDAFHLFCSCKLIMSWLAGNVCASGSLQHFYTHTHTHTHQSARCRNAYCFFFTTLDSVMQYLLTRCNRWAHTVTHCYTVFTKSNSG